MTQRQRLIRCLLYEGVDPDKVEQLADDFLSKRNAAKIDDFIASSEEHRRMHTQ